MSDPKSPHGDNLLLPDTPASCIHCQGGLCLRQQVINLSLGKVDEMKCLRCLGEESDQTAESVLSSLKEYIYRRDCFKKQWTLYADVSYCPNPMGCFPDICFEEIV